MRSTLHFTSPKDFAGMRVTVMGLGLHGGGLASSIFFAQAGAIVTVTDTRTESELASSIAALSNFHMRFVLGRHEVEDFSQADMVIKNPAVRRTSKFLAAAKDIQTDISIFLRLSTSPLIAVTGSKGKSSVASALQFGLSSSGKTSLLGGNITVSPLTFLDKTGPDIPVVLELSSWQLADLKGMGVLKPAVAVLTAILPDHMNYYSSMEEYVADKRIIFQNQDGSDFTLCDIDQSWGRRFMRESKATTLAYSSQGRPEYGAWLEKRPPSPARGYCRLPPTVNPEIIRGNPGEVEEIVPQDLMVRGDHMRKNLLASGLALRLFGLAPKEIAEAAGKFPGIEHRLEFFAESEGVMWYNDSASTIPQAVAAALDSFDSPVILISGGTDKNLDFSNFEPVYKKPAGIVLLAGTATDKLTPLLKNAGIGFKGPYDTLDEAVKAAREMAAPGDSVVFSPGAASFGMFLHEFDRGKKFKDAVKSELGIFQ